MTLSPSPLYYEMQSFNITTLWVHLNSMLFLVTIIRLFSSFRLLGNYINDFWFTSIRGARKEDLGSITPTPILNQTTIHENKKQRKNWFFSISTCLDQGPTWYVSVWWGHGRGGWTWPGPAWRPESAGAAPESPPAADQARNPASSCSRPTPQYAPAVAATHYLATVNFILHSVLTPHFDMHRVLQQE